MRINVLKLVVLSLISASTFSIFSCSKSTSRGAFTEKEPYALIIKKEKNYYQAERISNRLSKKNIENYILKDKNDEENWYNVVSSALKDSSEISQLTAVLDSMKLKPLGVLNYNSLDSVNRVTLTEKSVKEIRRIAAIEPKVPAEVKAVLNKFPANDMFYVQNMSVTPLTDKGIEGAKGQKMDLPRGLKLPYLKKKGCTAFSSVIYKDNLFGDQVTLQIAKYGNCKTAQHASFVPIPSENNSSTLELCSEIADLILETGDYQDENKDGFKISAYKELVGYKVSLTDRKVTRNYYILTDEDGEFVYMTQSTKESDSDIIEMLKEVGKTDGLVSYQEFYNSFYLQSDQLDESDQFLGYYLHRLTKQYATERSNQKWARKMVGHWETTYFYNNSSKGLYSISIFDMLTGDKRREIYNQLYMKNDKSNGKEKRTIYGAPGIALYSVKYNPYFGLYNQLSEMSFGYGQFIIAIAGVYGYNESDLIARLESMQFEEGGYLAYKERKNQQKTEEDSGEL